MLQNYEKRSKNAKKSKFCTTALSFKVTALCEGSQCQTPLRMLWHMAVLEVVAESRQTIAPEAQNLVTPDLYPG